MKIPTWAIDVTRRLHRATGSAAIEAALILPVLFLLTTGLFDLGFAFYGYKKWTLSVLALSGALAPLLQQIPEVYFFGVGDMGSSYNLLALVIRMISGAVYAIILVKPIAIGLAKAGVLRGTAVGKEEAAARVTGQPRMAR